MTSFQNSRYAPSSILFGCLAIAFVLFSCKKDKEIVTETITVNDTLIIADTFPLSDTSTIFILVRHAETTGTGSDPNLSTAGQERANELSRTLENVPLNAVFSTNFNRTMQTAEPTANDQMLTIENYDPSHLDAFVDTNLSRYRNGIILVTGHSNTTPSLLNILVGKSTYPDFPETEYDNLFIVTAYKKGSAVVTHLKYGK